MSACDKFKGLLMGLLDKELTPEESSEVNDHLTRCAKCREEYEQLRETGRKIESLSFKEPQDEILEKLWKSPYSRFSRLSGLILVFGGWIFLIGYGLIQFLIHGHSNLFTKIPLAAIILGFIVLLFNVIRERLKKYKSDPYKEVMR